MAESASDASASVLDPALPSVVDASEEQVLVLAHSSALSKELVADPWPLAMAALCPHSFASMEELQEPQGPQKRPSAMAVPLSHGGLTTRSLQMDELVLRASARCPLRSTRSTPGPTSMEVGKACHLLHLHHLLESTCEERKES